MGKKEIIILTLVSLVLVGVLVFRKSERVNYSFPDIKALDQEKVVALEYTKDGEQVKLYKNGSLWAVEGLDYKIDQIKALNLVKDFNSLQFLEQVSTQENFKMFGLNEEDAIGVSLSDGKNTIEYKVGSMAGSRGTYAYFPGSKGVFTLKGNISKNLPEKPSDLRDKSVLFFDVANLSKVELQKDGEVLALTWDSEKNSWLQDNEAFEKSEDFARQIRSLGQLKCTEFMDTELDGTPLLSLRFIGEGDDSLQIYNKVDLGYEASSTQSDDDFIISNYIVDGLLKFFE